MCVCVCRLVEYLRQLARVLLLLSPHLPLPPPCVSVCAIARHVASNIAAMLRFLLLQARVSLCAGLLVYLTTTRVYVWVSRTVQRGGRAGG